jgi:TBC1 domain family member 10
MVSASMYATQWYATVYAISLPFPFVIRIWDVFLVYGFNILYKVGIAILKFMQRDLLKEEFEGIMKILRNLNKYLAVTPDEFINSIMEFQLSDKKLQKISKDYEANQGQVWK